MKGKILDICMCAFFAFAVLTGLAIERADAADVYGALSNFDLHVTAEEANDMELILVGEGLTCDDIWYIYPGWGSANFICEDIVPFWKIKLTWSDPGDPLEYCDYPHFGVGLNYDAPGDVRVESATWTMDGSVVGQISFMWQRWVGSFECPVVDIIEPPMDPIMDDVAPWEIRGREWAYVEPTTNVELEDLMRDNAWLNAQTWIPVVEDSVLFSTGDSLAFSTTPVTPGGWVLVRYDVWEMGPDGDSLRAGTYMNAVPTVPRLPSLTEYGIAVLVLLLLISAIWIYRKRKAGAVA